MLEGRAGLWKNILNRLRNVLMGTLWGLEKADAKPCFQGGMAPCNRTDWVLIHYNTAFQKRTGVSRWAVSRAGVNSVLLWKKGHPTSWACISKKATRKSRDVVVCLCLARESYLEKILGSLEQERYRHIDGSPVESTMMVRGLLCVAPPGKRPTDDSFNLNYSMIWLVTEHSKRLITLTCSECGCEVLSDRHLSLNCRYLNISCQSCSWLC